MLCKVQKQTRLPKSDELMADLETQLGDAQMQYIKIKVDYSHSAFSDYSGTEILAGISQRYTRMDTTVMASMKRHNVCSAWSPLPGSCRDALRDIVARHWGQEKAAEYFNLMATPRKPVKSYSPISSLRLRPKETRAAQSSAPPTIPVRRTSLQREVVPQSKPATVLGKAGYEPVSNTSRPTGARHQTSGVREHSSVIALGRRFRTASSETQQSRSASLGKRKSFATEILRSLTPRVPNVYTSSIHGSNGREEESSRQEREQSFWGWTSWF